MTGQNTRSKREENESNQAVKPGLKELEMMAATKADGGSSRIAPHEKPCMFVYACVDLNPVDRPSRTEKRRIKPS